MRSLKNFVVAAIPHSMVSTALSAKSALRARRKLPLYLARIRSHFPDLSFRDARLLDHSFANVVIILDKEWIFRFPRDEWQLAKFRRELQLLSILRSRTNIRMPDYCQVAAGNCFGGYRLIPGSELGPALFASLDRPTQETVLDQYTGFLSALHDIPTHLAGELQLPQAVDNTYYCDAYFNKRRKFLAYNLDNDLLAQLDEFFEMYRESQKFEKCVVHCDIDDNHVLWDRKGERLAIIDFGNAAMADPALDFAFLFTLPGWAASFAFERYRRAHRQPGLFQRALHHAICHALWNVWNCLHRDGQPRNLADTIDALKAQLALLHGQQRLLRECLGYRHMSEGPVF